MSWFWRSTTPPKPSDLIKFSPGFACKSGHCQSYNFGFSCEGLAKDQICETCGEKSFPAVIKETTGHIWQPVAFSSAYWGREASTYEFVRFLDEDTVRLPEETVAKLRKYAARKPVDSDEDADRAYQNGLNDGTILTAQYVLGKLEDETNA
jgi:hypothetical protein